MTSETRAAELIEELTTRGMTIAVAESLTGGLLSAELTAVPGASACVRGGVVAYATDLKAHLLGVPAELLDDRGPVDPDVAEAMARGVAAVCGTDMGIATTGVAGPDSQGAAPVGLVYIATYLSDDGVEQVEECRFSGSRDQIRTAVVERAVALALAMFH
ncbi:MAG: CinA family protein [Candidatus Nanopelagicales bacterium]